MRESLARSYALMHTYLMSNAAIATALSLILAALSLVIGKTSRSWAASTWIVGSIVLAAYGLAAFLMM